MTAEAMSQGVEPAANRDATERLMKAMREHDYTTIADVLAPDVVINSPITGTFHFRGRENAMAVLKIVSDSLTDLEHYELVGSDDVWAQRFRARARGRELEGIDLLRYDDTGRLREMTVFVRPLPGLAAFAAAVGPPVGRRCGRLTAIILQLLIEPLKAMTHYGDKLVGWLLRDTWGAGGRG